MTIYAVLIITTIAVGLCFLALWPGREKSKLIPFLAGAILNLLVLGAIALVERWKTRRPRM